MSQPPRRITYIAPAVLIGSLSTLTACGLAGTTIRPVGADAAAKRSIKRNVDTSRLKLGDGKVTTSGPKRGRVYSCQSSFGNFTSAQGPWIDGNRWDLSEKPTVDGNVDWPAATFSADRSGSVRQLAGNGLPFHMTGKFPISPSDDAYQYDRNPNSIGASSLSIEIPARPTPAASPSCVGLGMIGVINSGAAVFNALDGGGNDATAHEIQDRCGGHPERTGQYHYHALPACAATGNKKKHSKRIGWALDGYPIYGPRGKQGRYMTKKKLDRCHGAWRTIKKDGKKVRKYGYYATMRYPYTIGCFKGTPTR